MKISLLDQFIRVLILLRLTTHGSEPTNIYNTTSGMYEAEIIELNGYEFDGEPVYVHRLTSVPYGEKPGRFEQARMKNYQPGLQFAPRQLVSCYQSVNLSSYGAFNLLHPPLMIEDCLTINLYIPIGKKRTANINNTVKPSVSRLVAVDADYRNLSVVVHIHGGSNMVGGAGLFDGSILAAHGRVVVAVINYRLSILGFLSDMTHKYPGNYGLRDQLLAIKLNCNPNSITLWGHSAGAGDVNWLAMSPMSNRLFQRVIIQSGSAFTYWGFDKLPHERYKSLRTYFNCTHAPAEYTPYNQAMTILIDTCLKNMSLDDLFSFKFALIDAPGPIYDGFISSEHALITRPSPKEMLMDDRNYIVNLDIMTGINRVEGFSFEGYFADSTNFWTKSNLTTEVALSMERISLLTRERCQQNSIISNRLKFEEFYSDKVRKNLSPGGDMKSEEARRMKAIFANSDAIFDTGFVEFLHLIATKKADMMRRGLLNKSNLYVYEYLHESSGSQPNSLFKKLLIKNYTLSTHFDGIDLVFGLPIAYKYRKNKSSYDYPFKDFQFEIKFNDDDVALSLVLMKYYSNFIKNGNPNVGIKVPKKWEPYMNNKAYLILDKSLTEMDNSSLTQRIDREEQQTSLVSASTSSPYGKPSTWSNATSMKLHTRIREDLYNFWFVELEKSGRCASYERHHYHHYHYRMAYESARHTQGRDRALDDCLGRLDAHTEYMYLREMFLIEYEHCINAAPSSGPHADRLRNLFNTVCLDIIAVRRMLIEYQVCCTNKTIAPEAICSTFDDASFNASFVDYKLKDLIDYVIVSYTTNSGTAMISTHYFNINQLFSSSSFSNQHHHLYLSSSFLLVLVYSIATHLCSYLL